MADSTLDVLAIAPHPDDLEITCGGTLALMGRQGYRVGMLDLTTGEPTPRGTEEIRAREAEAARQALGIPWRQCLGLPNRVLMDSPENRMAVATVIRRLRPKIIITMAGRTPAASPDHHQGHLLVEGARFYSQLTKWNDRFAGTEPYRVPHLVYAPVPFDAEVRHWHGQFVIDITETFETKLASVACYLSQFDPARLTKVEHWLRSWNGSVGGRCGYTFGELFALPQPVGGSDLVSLVSGMHSGPAPVELPGQSMPHG